MRKESGLQRRDAPNRVAVGNLVTVIVPVYGVEPYLNECLHSIAGQTYANLEVILVDDGSLDGCGAICDRWAREDERVLVVHQENRGLSAARNAGLDFATGDYVVFVDPDDTVEPTYVEVLLAAAVRMGVPCVTCGLAEREGEEPEFAYRPTKSAEVISARDFFARALGFGPSGRARIPAYVWSRIYSRSLFGGEGVRFPEGEVYEDLSILFQIIQSSERVGLIPEVLYHKRAHEGSITQTNSIGNLRDMERAQVRLVESVRESFPDLAVEADRFLVGCRISSWLKWCELVRSDGSGETREGAERARTYAIEHWHDLQFPDDWRYLLKLLMLRVSPDLAIAAKSLWKRVRRPGELRRNAARHGAATLAGYLLALVTTLYAARVLAPAGLGSASFASSVVGYFALLAQLGIPLYGMRLCAKMRDDSVELAQALADLLCLQSALAIGSALLLAAVTALVPQIRDVAPLVSVYGVGLLSQAIGLEWALRGLERFRYLLVRGVVVRSLALAATVLLVRGPGDLMAYAAVSVAAGVACGACDLVYVRGIAPGRVPSAPRPWRHLRPALTFFLMSCAVLAYTNLDTVLLGLMRAPAEVGWYQVAAKARVALSVVGGVVWTVALPRATTMWERGDREGFAHLARRSLRAVCLANAALAAALVACAGWLVPFLLGQGYAPAVPAVRVVALSLVPIGTSNIIGGQVLVPAGRERRLLAAELCGAAADLLLDLALIPRLGIVGAAWGTVAAEVAVALVAYWFARRDLHVGLFPWDRRLASALHAAKARVVSWGYRVEGVLIPEGSEAGLCPCCGTRMRRWCRARFRERPDLYDARRYAEAPQDVVCPVCGSIPRHRIIAWHLSQRPELVRGKRVLHFAPERGLTTWFGANGVSVTTADLYAPADLKLDIQDIDLPDASYDVIVCNHVLEHVADWRRALAELRRVLRPGGLLVCSFPVDSRLETVDEDDAVTTREGRIERFGQFDHLRVFGRDSPRLLEEAGFQVELARGADCPDAIRPVTGPADYDSPDVFLCWKR